jgi:hypothetical protein
MFRRLFLIALGFLGWVADSPVALACAACFGKSDSAMARGMNAGIFALLAFVFVAWIAFGSFFVFIVRRSRSVSEPLPGDQDDPQHN